MNQTQRVRHAILASWPAAVASSSRVCYAQAMTELLEDALRKVATLPKEEQDAIASQIIETLQDEARWKETLASNSEKLGRLGEEARREYQRAETRPIDELL